ncbi:hypothetical protein GQR58_029673 [Nymphon striatum]|nr:hypothetical protein GQR58_029673 [Nymphon striatum]
MVCTRGRENARTSPREAVRATASTRRCPQRLGVKGKRHCNLPLARALVTKSRSSPRNGEPLVTYGKSRSDGSSTRVVRTDRYGHDEPWERLCLGASELVKALRMEAGFLVRFTSIDPVLEACGSPGFQVPPHAHWSWEEPPSNSERKLQEVLRTRRSALPLDLPEEKKTSVVDAIAELQGRAWERSVLQNKKCSWTSGPHIGEDAVRQRRLREFVLGSYRELTRVIPSGDAAAGAPAE